MGKKFIQANSFVLKKHNLRVYRIKEPGKAILLFTSEQQAAHYVQKLHFQKLIVEKKYR